MKTLKIEEIGKNTKKAFLNFDAQRAERLIRIKNILEVQRAYDDENFQKLIYGEIKHLVRLNDKRALLYDLLTDTIT